MANTGFGPNCKALGIDCCVALLYFRNSPELLSKQRILTTELHREKNHRVAQSKLRVTL